MSVGLLSGGGGLLRGFMGVSGDARSSERREPSAPNTLIHDN